MRSRAIFPVIAEIDSATTTEVIGLTYYLLYLYRIGQLTAFDVYYAQRKANELTEQCKWVCFLYLPSAYAVYGK